MDLCRKVINLSRNVCNFIDKAKPYEDSITDFIIWQIRKFYSRRIHYLNLDVLDTRRIERRTGADIEIVFTYANESLHLLIQAKRIYERGDSNTNMNNIECFELRRRTNQIETLINYSIQENKLPFYLFYSIDDRNIELSCRYLCQNITFILRRACLILRDAFSINNVYQNTCQNGGSIPTYDLVNHGNPFFVCFAVLLYMDIILVH